MNLSPCECEAELLWVCASPCVGEHTHLWLSALVGHFMSLCVNRNEILEWPFSRTFYFFYTLVSERQYSGALFFVFFLRYLLVFQVRGLWAAGIDARSLQFFLTNLTHESSWSHLISSAIRPCLSYVRLCGSKRERGRIVLLMVFSLSPGSDEVWLFFLRVLLAIFTAIWRTIWI